MIRCSTTGDAMALRWASVDGRETWATSMNWDSNVFPLCSVVISNIARVLIVSTRTKGGFPSVRP